MLFLTSHVPQKPVCGPLVASLFWAEWPVHWLCICCSTAKRVLVGFSGSSLAPFFIWYRVMSCHARQSGRQPSPAYFVDRHIYIIDSGGPWKGVPCFVGKARFSGLAFLGAVGGTYTYTHTHPFRLITKPTFFASQDRKRGCGCF